jgi:hypothetical protein
MKTNEDQRSISKIDGKEERLTAMYLIFNLICISSSKAFNLTQ